MEKHQEASLSDLNYRRCGLFIHILALSLVFALTAAGCRSVPRAMERLRITDGIAVSLNHLEKSGKKFLPPLDITGITVDRQNNDWVIIGNRNPKVKPMPIDAVKVALRAARFGLEAPGVDIRPVSAEDRNSQAVTYFAGVEQTIVGFWFFDFDYWMKRAALGDAPVIPQVPVYWRRVIADAQAQDFTKQRPQAQGTRLWLCAGKFTGKDERDTLTFDNTTMHVFAERLQDANKSRKALPCATQGVEDKLAGEFAKALDTNLDRLQNITPIEEIKGFSRLYQAFLWAMQRDPYRELTPWIGASVAKVDTPMVVPTVGKQHEIVRHGDRVIHKMTLHVAGGVSIRPTLVIRRGYEEILQRLQRAVLAARPAAEKAMWPFKFDSASEK